MDIGSTFIKYEVYNQGSGELEMWSKVPFPEPVLNRGDRFLVSCEQIGNKIFEIFDLTKDYDVKKTYIRSLNRKDKLWH